MECYVVLCHVKIYVLLCSAMLCMYIQCKAAH